MILSSKPCLALVDFADPTVPLELVTVASGSELGSTLLTLEDEAICSIAYYSRKLSDSE